MSTVAKLYMKLTKKGSQSAIDGESVTEHFEKQIEIDDWDWEVASKEVSSSGTDTAKGAKPEVEVSEFSFSKLMDRATTPMMHAMLNGDLLDAEITLQEMSRDAFELKVSLYDIRVSDYQMDGRNDKAAGEINERWKFNYSRIKFDFKPAARADGKVSGVMTADAIRAPGAKPKAITRTGDEMLKLAGKLNLKEWSTLMPQLRDIERKASGQTPNDVPPTR